MPEYCMLAPHAPTVANKTTLDTSKESATQALYRATIGPLNRDYYLPIFSGFEETAKIALRWNTAASLYTLNWMVFRRLWGAALIYASTVGGATLIAFALSRLIFDFSTEGELALAIVMLTLTFVVPGLFGNTWLHADSRRRMAEALNHSTTLQQACDQLTAQSSSRNRFLGVIAVNIVVLSAALGLWLRPDGYMEVKEPQPLPVIDQAMPPKRLPLTVMPPPETAVSVIEPPTAPPPPLESAPAPELPVPPSPLNTITPPPLLNEKSVAAEIAVASPFYVNVGLFANPDNAERVHRRLNEAGLPVTTEILNMSKGKRSRVRVGPFSNRLKADEAARSIRELGLDAVVRQQ